ncbi:MAG: hypothetical protein JNL11_17610 [Bdellovibrionaceae bacterium]|nr:hypothetical protein [Pseudobdellovibrionaceae bacterium]
MLSLTKSMFVGLVLCLASVSWSLPQTFKSCEPTAKFSVDYKIADKNISLAYAGVDETGKSFQGTSTYEILESQSYDPSVFEANTVKNMHAIAGISNFTQVHVLALNSGGSQPSTLWLFEFEPNQYSVVWIVEGSLMVFGKTNTCN